MSERRAHPRLRGEERVAVTILKAPDAPELEGGTFFCSAADLSVSGLRLCVHCRLPVGAQLRMLVAFSDPLRSFTPVGDVVWVRDSGRRPPYAMGVRFADWPAVQLGAWRQTVSDKLAVAGDADIVPG